MPWFEQIILLPTIEKIMDNFWIQLLPEILPKSFLISRIVNDEVHNLQHCATKSGVNSDQCNTVIQIVINGAKAVELSPDNLRDASVVATAVICGWKFATKELKMPSKLVMKTSYLSTIFDVILCWLLTAHKNCNSSFSSQKIVALFQGKMQYLYNMGTTIWSTCYCTQS